MAIDFVPNENPKNVTPSKGKDGIDFISHETVGGHLRDIGNRLLQGLSPQEFANLNKASDSEKTAIKVANALWQSSPYILAGEAAGLANAPRFVSMAAENMPKVAKYLTNLAGVTGKNALFGGGAGAAESVLNGETKDIGQNTLRGAALGGAIGGSANIGLDVLNALRPSNILRSFKGTATPEETKIAAEMAGNLPIGLGKILQSPALEEIEKTANRIPLSGGINRAEKVEQAAEDQTDKLLTLMRGNAAEEDLAHNLQEGILKNAQGHKAEATRLYEDFLNTAKEQGVKITETPETQMIAKNILRDYQENQTPLDEKIIKRLEKLSEPDLIPDAVKGQVSRPKEIDEMHNQIKSLKKSARLVESKDPYLANTYNELAAAMRKDFENSLTGNNIDLYHGTTNKNSKNILDEGLIAQKFHSLYPTLTNDRNLAAAYSARHSGSDEPESILKISIPKNELNKYVHEKNIDWASKSNRPRGFNDAETYGLKSNIPPNFISKHDLNEKIIDRHLISNKLSYADKYYKENVVPYKQNDIQNIIGGKTNLENIQNTLTQSKDHIEKIVDDLSPVLKKNAAYLKFKSAIKENEAGVYTSEPQKLFNAYNRLSPVQKDKLFTKTEQKEFQRLGFLARAAQDKGKSSQYLKAAELGIPLYEALGHGNLLGAAKVLGTGALLGLGARGVGNALTSPAMRNAVINPSATNTLSSMMPAFQGAAIGAEAQPPESINIDFQPMQGNSLNNIDADLINNQIMSSQ